MLAPDPDPDPYRHRRERHDSTARPFAVDNGCRNNGVGRLVTRRAGLDVKRVVRYTNGPSGGQTGEFWD